MRKLYALLLLIISITSFGQAPQLIPYQAIARDATGQALANTSINARFTIHDETATGTTVWQEIQTITTSALGLFTAQLGSNVSLGSVNWASGSKFMQVEIDMGSGFVEIGTQQMLSVPYALYAASVKIEISAFGDTLYIGDGNYLIIPGASIANADDSGQFNPAVEYGSVTDHEGKIYRTIQLQNGQEWMAENLRTSTYQDGTPISSNWTQNTLNGACDSYNGNTNLDSLYGKLYNWYAASSICPSGWHLPNTCDFGQLLLYVDASANGFFNSNYDCNFNSDTAGWKLKTTSDLFWNYSIGPIENYSMNSIGFSAMGSGARDWEYGHVNGFSNFGQWAKFWAINNYENNADAFVISNSNYASVTSVRKYKGHSIRCIKD